MYDKTKAEQFWSRRASEVNDLRAVLSYNLPDYVNQAYSDWELGLLMKTLGDIAGREVLDVACGVGRVSMELLGAGAKVTAVDNAQKMLDITTGKAAAAGLDKNLTTVKSSADELAFPDESFETVVCVGLLEHLPPDVRQKTMEHLFRILKKGGSLFLIVNNEDSVFLKQVESYRMGQQQDSGYFVGIIGMAFVRDFFTARGARVENLGSNLFHSYLRHTNELLTALDPSGAVAETFMRQSLAVDLNSAAYAELGKGMADQFLVRIAK